MNEQEKPVNQWHEQILRQANERPISEKLWPQTPSKPEIVVYEWPESETV